MGIGHPFTRFVFDFLDLCSFSIISCLDPRSALMFHGFPGSIWLATCRPSHLSVMISFRPSSFPSIHSKTSSQPRRVRQIPCFVLVGSPELCSCPGCCHLSLAFPTRFGPLIIGNLRISKMHFRRGGPKLLFCPFRGMTFASLHHLRSLL